MPDEYPNLKSNSGRKIEWNAAGATAQDWMAFKQMPPHEQAMIVAIYLDGHQADVVRDFIKHPPTKNKEFDLSGFGV